MVKKEKVKEDPYVLEIKTYDDREKLSNFCTDYLIKTKDKEVKFEINSRTSSCGSIQIMNMFIGKYQAAIDSGLSLKQRKEILETIKEKHKDFNHIFFIDMAQGALERFFANLGFEKCWTYFNPNSENVVNMWSLNKQTEDEYYESQGNDDEDETDYSW